MAQVATGGAVKRPTLGYTIGAGFTGTDTLRLGLWRAPLWPRKRREWGLVFVTSERAGVAVWRTRADAIKAWRTTQQRAPYVVRWVVKRGP